MIFRLLADGVLLVHLTYMVFVAGGGLLVVKWPKVVWAHLPAVAWGVLVESAGWICPLTPLENWLSRAGGASGYAGDFIAHYVSSVIYPTSWTRQIQLATAVGAAVLNLAIYVLVLWLRRRGRRRQRFSRAPAPPARQYPEP